MANKEYLKELVAFMQQKGFVWGPEPELYGGLAGFYSYGPLGKLLKNNVENIIRKVFTKNHFFEVEIPIIMPKIVWEASGHLKSFTDKIITCARCNSTFRVDNFIEEMLDLNVTGKSDKEMLEIIKKNKLKCPNCNNNFKEEIKEHSLMMKTTVGLDLESYSRPETATTTYLPFVRYFDYFRKKMPFGVFQIGKAFRNEVSPRQHLLRMREFTQAEAQLFIFEHQKNDFELFEDIKEKRLPLWTSSNQKNNKDIELISLKDAVKQKVLGSKAYAYALELAYELILQLGIPSENIRLRQHHKEEKAFYAADAWDLEVKTKSFGWVECVGVHDRTDYDLKQHSKKSKTNLEVYDEQTSKRVLPHIIEIAFGTDRPIFALLDNFYEKMEKGEGKTTFRIPPILAPVKVAIFPLIKKDELVKLAKKIFFDLSNDFICVYDETSSIGRRYLRANSDGIPYCITVDFDSLQKEDVTIRDRDTEKQFRVKIEELSELIRKLLNNKLLFNEIKGEPVK